MQYKINIKNTDEGYAVWCEDLPGCASRGDTEDEAKDNIKDAIRKYPEVRNELQGISS